MADPNPNDEEAKKAAEARAAAEAAPKAQEALERKTHTRMRKDGEKPIYVHPTCVEDHKKVGWSEF